MYDSLANFLRSFSSGYPILWALLVMVVVVCAALSLYGFWELVLRSLMALFRPRNEHRSGKQE